MRQLLLISVLIALAGCTATPRDKRAASGGDSLPPRDFVGLPPDTGPEREGVPGTPARGALGFLAGEVQDSQYRRVANATIQVIEMEDGGRPRAKLSVNTDRNGYFDVPGLEKGRRYQLVASIQRGEVQYVGRTFAVTNNTRVAIYLTDTRRGGGVADAGPGGEGRTAPATLGAPTRQPGDGVGKSLDPPPAVVTDPLRTARDRERRDFDSGTPPATVTVPGPGRDTGDDPSRKPFIPPAPPLDGGTTTPLPGAAPATPTPAPASGSVRRSRGRGMPGRTVIPSCVKVGYVVEELALNDSHGQPWSLREQQTGKLVLLDFWKVNCPPCRAALPKLVELQKKYGPAGLQVIGVLCDGGPVARRQDGMLLAARQQGITFNYPVLFSEPGECPVRRELDVFVYPSLRLLNEDGRVIWKGEGYTPESAAELEDVIRKRLGATP